MQKKGKFLLLGICSLLTMFAAGCTKKDLFVEEGAEYKLEALDDNSLEDGTYYVKDGTKFYSVYLPTGNCQATANSVSSDRLYFVNKDYSLIPSYYSDELIAYQTTNTSLTDISLERFCDLGYSIGLYGGVIDDDGYICYSVSKNTVPDSSAYNELKQAASDSIRIISIDGESVNSDTINSAGVFSNLEKGETYKLGFYAGSKYQEADVKADYRILQSYEYYTIDKATNTKNGYLAINMPKDAKSGYYLINGAGFFRYYAFEKGTEKRSKTDMNVAYYESESEKIQAYSQQYVVSVETATTNVGFTITYDADTYNDADITSILTSPDGTKYDMVAENGTIHVELAQVIAGRWTINIMPKDMEIEDINISSVAPTEEATTEETDIAISEDLTAIRFYVDYTGDGDIWGTITDENGNAVNFESDSKNQKLYANYSYLPAGTYHVTIYHYADTAVNEVSYEDDTDSLEEEILTVEE